MKLIVEGLRFPEDPRHCLGNDGEAELWFSDLHDQKVFCLKSDGAGFQSQPEVVLELKDDRPSGLGWLPNGDLLIVAMETRKVYRFDGKELSIHADLADLSYGDLNDMAVSNSGNAYVGCMGFNIQSEDLFDARDAEIFLVSPTGEVEVAADGLRAPNGIILTPDEKTLIVAETSGSRLTSYDVDPETGKLSNRQIFAQPESVGGKTLITIPDGICLDGQGAVWMTDIGGRRVIRVLRGGEITDSYEFLDVVPFACCLAGKERKQLMVCVSSDYRSEHIMKKPSGAIYQTEVEVAGAGKP